MKIWQINHFEGRSFLVSAKDYTDLVDKLSAWWGTVQLNTGTSPFIVQPFTIDGVEMGNYHRILEDELNSILNNGVELLEEVYAKSGG